MVPLEHSVQPLNLVRSRARLARTFSLTQARLALAMGKHTFLCKCSSILRNSLGYCIIFPFPYSYVGVTIGPTYKYQSEPYDRAKEARRVGYAIMPPFFPYSRKYHPFVRKIFSVASLTRILGRGSLHSVNT